MAVSFTKPPVPPPVKAEELPETVRKRDIRSHAEGDLAGLRGVAGADAAGTGCGHRHGDAEAEGEQPERPDSQGARVSEIRGLERGDTRGGFGMWSIIHTRIGVLLSVEAKGPGDLATS